MQKTILDFWNEEETIIDIQAILEEGENAKAREELEKIEVECHANLRYTTISVDYLRATFRGKYEEILEVLKKLEEIGYEF